MAVLRYHTDPACSASWAAEPRLRRLIVEFGDTLDVSYVMGGLAREFEDLPALLRDCAALLSDGAAFLLLNAYAARISGLSLAHLMAEATAGRQGRIDWGELALAEEQGSRAIGLSFFARWSAA